MTLSEYISRHLEAPFQYGVNDCVIFSISWAQIKVGRELLPLITWHDENSANDAINSVGGLVEAIDSEFNRIEGNYAVDGDLAIVKGIVHIYSGRHVVSVGKTGLKFRSRQLAEISWRVE